MTLRIFFLLGALIEMVSCDCLCNTTLNQEILFDFYVSAGGASWSVPSESRWKFGDPSSTVCDWLGVYCDDGYDVRRLLFADSSIKMVGSLSERIGEFTQLVSITIINQVGIVGSVPQGLYAIDTLQVISLGANALVSPWWWPGGKSLRELWLYRNQLTGTIPADFGFNLPLLIALHLDGNLIVGSIPRSFGALGALEDLDLSDNHINGTLPSFRNLTRLRILRIDHSNLAGAIPEDIGYSSQLVYLVLRGNGMSGTLPQSMSSLQSLRTLGLGETRFHGPLDTVFSLSELVVLDAGSSKFDGTIPSFKALRNLVILKLPGNLLCGEIPDDIGNAKNLSSLELNSNRLNGTLPVGLKELHVLRIFTVGYNFFVGDIEVVASLTLLSTLNLAFNTFRGTIPSMFGSMPTLQELQLAHNNLSGFLPSALSTSQSLIAADFSYNQLEGELPPEYGNMTALRNFSAAANSLRGGVPWEWCGMPLDHLDLGNNTAINTSLESLLQCLGSLRVLRLGRTTVTGPLWQEPFVTSKLVELNISNCSVSAPLPQALPSSLVVFDGSYNSFIGALPESWATAPLRLVALDRSNINGTLPESWAALSNLMQLHLDGNSVSGTLPSGWGALSNLMQLHLDGNSVSGALPSGWGALSNLMQLHLDGNSVSGALPSGWGALSNLMQLHLDDNNIIDTLPSSWGALSQLRTVVMTSNSLSGSLPPQWSNLKQVNTILLSGNFLSGALPASWGILPVQVLLLSNNSLTGSLPDSWGSMRSLARLDLSHNQINGTLPSAWSQFYTPVMLVLHYNRLSGSIPPSWVATPVYVLTLHNNLLDAPLADMLPVMLYILLLNENRIPGSLPSNWGLAMKPPFSISPFRRKDVDALLIKLPLLQRLIGDGSAHVFFNLSCNQLVGAVPSSWAPLLQAEPPAVSLCNNFIENTSYSQRALLNCAVNLSAPVSPVANITFIARPRATSVASLGVAVAAVGLVNYGGAAAMGMRSIFVYQVAVRCLEGQQSPSDGGDTEPPNDVSGDLMGISVGPLDACRFHRGAVVGDFALALSVAAVGLSASLALIARRLHVTGIGTEVSWVAKCKLLWKAAAVLKLPGSLLCPARSPPR